jgi:DNA-binding response OmpR family regulator
MDHPGSARILVVEDDPDIRGSLADLFQWEGFAVAVARDGEDGLRVGRAFRPDLVLLDLAMPVLDGFGFLERWRADAATAAVPVIVLTARPGAVVPGCRVVAKPFDLDALLALARSALAPSAPPVAAAR